MEVMAVYSPQKHKGTGIIIAQSFVLFVPWGEFTG
jgi:hypothetical protein